MKKYRRVIWSDSSYPREYIVHTTSAHKAATMLGRCEGGEVVEVRRVMSDVVLSRVVWTAGQYIRVEVQELAKLYNNRCRDFVTFVNRQKQHGVISYNHKEQM